MPRLLACLAFIALTATARAQTSFPMITHTVPTAAQRGTTAEVSIEGLMNFAGAYKVLFREPGLAAEVIPAKDPKATTRTVKLKLTVAPDARVGVHDFRLATSLGVSSLGQVLVTPDPVVVEQPGKNTPKAPQAIPLPCVVCGRIEIAENVDAYKFAAKAGQRITIETFAARIQDKIHDLQKHIDPLVAILDVNGRELAADDDGHFADPAFTFAVPADGDYTVLVRDAKYDGDPRWTYALAITDRPAAAHAFPLAVNPGTKIMLEPVGSAKAIAQLWDATAPSVPGIHAVSLRHGAHETNPVPVVATNLPLANETEPNDKPKEATRLSIPGGMNARIGTKRDLDHFVFAGKKGVPIAFEIFARRFGTPLRSRLDSIVDIMTPDGRVLASNDDATGKDAALTFAAPADGDYVLRVRDLNNKGGDGFAYFLAAEAAKPDFALKLDPAKAMIGPGSRTAWYVTVTRTNGFTAPVKIEIRNLPKGVAVNSLTIPTTMTQGCLVLSAAADAKLDASIVEVVGTAEGLTRTAIPDEEIYLPGGGRGRFPATMPAVAVTDASDVLEVKVKSNRIALKPGEEVKIEVEVKRRADYDKPLTLDVILRHLGQKFADSLPPGVTMVDANSKTLLGTGSVGHITLRAAPDAAEIADVPIAVQAFVPVNFVVKIGYSSEPILVSVRK
jgi:Bacterial pre-peptidase C-terminal domain